MSVAIFKGKNAKLLTSGELENGDGQVFSKYSERNYIANHSGAVNTSGWTATGTATVTRVTSSVPRATLGYGLQFAAGAAADYVRYRFTVDSADQAKKLKISFDMVPGSYTSGDMKVDLYATSDSSYATGLTRQALSTDASSVTALPNLTGTFRTTFDASSSLIYCELRIVRVSGSSTLTLSDIVVGPGIVTQGAAVTQWQSYTPTVVGNTTSANVAQYRRVGDTMQVQGYLTASNTTTTTLSVSLPSGLTINASALAKSGALDDVLGYVTVDGSTYVAGNVLYQSSTTVVFAKTGATSVINGTNTIVSGNIVDYSFTVPVNEWAGSGTVNLASNDRMSVSNDGSGGAAAATIYSTGMQTGQAGSQFVSVASTDTAGNITKYLVNWPYPVSLGSVMIEVTSDGGTTWQQGSSSLLSIGRLFQNASVYGAWYEPVSTTSGYMVFGNGGRFSTGASYGAAGSAWSGIAGSSSNKWRITGAIAGQTVGFGIVQPGVSSGLVSASGVPGNKTGAAIASGYVGEIRTASVLRASSISLTTATATNIATLPALDSGVWAISGWISAGGTSTVFVDLSGCISTTSATISTTYGVMSAVPDSGSTSFQFTTNDAGVPMPTIFVSGTTASSSTFYLVAIARFGSGTVNAYGTIQAVRIA